MSLQAIDHVQAHIAFHVDDVHGLAERARAAGYEVGDDPLGNRLEFLKPPSGETESLQW